MATTADVISQTSSINLITKSISSTRSSLSSTNSSIGRIQKIVETKTKVRNDLFFKNQIIERRRREASKRREYEDQIEASRVTTNFQSGLRVASSSSQGPLSRILSFLGYMGAGWIIENLPTWIGMGQEFIARMKRAGQIIYSIPQTMWRILQGFGDVLKSVGTNIRNLDFTDSSNEVQNSFTQLTDTIDLLGTQIVDGFKLLLQPTGEVEIPSTGEQQPDTGFPEVPVPSPGGGGSRYGTKEQQAALDSISFAEGNTGYSTWAGYQKHGPDDLTGLTIRQIHDLQTSFINSGKVNKTGSAVVGRYQFLTPYNQAKAAGLNPETDKFSPSNQDRMAIHIMNTLGVTAERLKKEGISVGVADRLATQWASFPYSPKGGRSYYGQGFKDIKQIQAVYKKSLGTSQSQTQTPTAPPRPVSTGTMNLIPQSGSGGFIQGGSGSGGDATYATHFHIDTKNANPNAAQLANIREVSFQAVKAMFARGSWVHFGNIKKDVYSNVSDSELKSLIAAEQRAHGARSSAAVDIQEHNPKTKQTFPSQPGSATKFPFAVGEVYYRGGYGREAEIVGTGGITVSHGASGSKASQISPQLAKVPSETSLTPPSEETQQPQISSLTPETQARIAEAVNQERMGQQILFIDDRSASQPATTTVSQKSYGGGTSGQITEFDMLNRFMKQKLLLDFNYL